MGLLLVCRLRVFKLSSLLKAFARLFFAYPELDQIVVLEGGKLLHRRLFDWAWIGLQLISETASMGLGNSARGIRLQAVKV